MDGTPGKHYIGAHSHVTYQCGGEPSKPLTFISGCNPTYKLAYTANSQLILERSKFHGNLLCPTQFNEFLQSLHKVLGWVMVSDTVLGTVYLCKVNLSDLYMPIWVFPEDIPADFYHSTGGGRHIVACMSLPLSPDGFHLFFPFFCMSTEKLIEHSKNTLI